jgi:FHA domain-containing protein
MSAPIAAPIAAPLANPALAPAPAQAAAPVVAGQADSAALWAAFCEGTGVRLDLPQGLTPEMMRVVGTLLRTAVEGTLQMMQVRAATKSEFRAAVTVIQARNNNPLKFSPNAENALEQMLQPPMRGFLSGPAAMTDAMNDLVGHAIGTMAGMRAALDGMLGRFTPAELEAKLVGSSMLDSLLPMNRKAKLWDLYLQHFESIRSEAQEDFHALFGKAFLAAYEQQLERLQARGGKS